MQESAHRALLRAHVGQGNSHEAIHLYRQLTAMLSRELGVTPSEETMAIMAAIDEAVA
jgi:DNA-binding SARP family transcriptional activator